MRYGIIRTQRTQIERSLGEPIHWLRKWTLVRILHDLNGDGMNNVETMYPVFGVPFGHDDQYQVRHQIVYRKDFRLLPQWVAPYIEGIADKLRRVRELFMLV